MTNATMHAFGYFSEEVELATEVFFDPYPEDLVVLSDSGKWREL